MFGGTQFLRESIFVGHARRLCRRAWPTKGDLGAAKPPPNPRTLECRQLFALEEYVGADMRLLDIITSQHIRRVDIGIGAEAADYNIIRGVVQPIVDQRRPA